MLSHEFVILNFRYMGNPQGPSESFRIICSNISLDVTPKTINKFLEFFVKIIKDVWSISPQNSESCLIVSH